MTGNSPRKKIHDPVDPARLVAFSDGVFAIAVTLLVFNLKVPEIPPAGVHRLLRGELLAMMPRFESYLLSFVLIAFFWTIHHRMLLAMCVSMESLRFGRWTLILLLPAHWLLSRYFERRKEPEE